MHVLIAENETKTATSLKQSLEEENHSVGVALDGRDVLEMAQEMDYDAIVLNVMLQGIDGFEVVRRLRKTGNKTPILVIGSDSSISDIVKGLDFGAHDYMSKPFYFKEFLARLRSVSRCATVSLPPVLKVADLVVNPAIHEVTRSGKKLCIGVKQYRLLEFLMRRAGHVVPNRTIIRSVWGSDETFDINTLHAFIMQLRSKIDRGHNTKLIRTVRSFGYGVIEPESR